MMTVDNQRYLIGVANLYSTDAIKAIKHSDYAKQIKNPEYGDMIKQDIDDFIDIVMENNFSKYQYLDTAARDGLMDILVEEFCFIDAEILMKLSDIVIKSIENNNKAAGIVSDKDIIKSIDIENKKLQRINSMLCRYAQRIDPDID